MTAAVDTGFNLSDRDRRRLAGVHPHLVRVVEQAAEQTNDVFMVVEGLRTLKRQQDLLKVGASRTLNSRHITGHAVDLAPVLDNGEIPWGQWDRFESLAATLKAAALYLKVPLEWGGDWPKFRDGPHFQLPHDQYPG